MAPHRPAQVLLVALWCMSCQSLARDADDDGISSKVDCDDHDSSVGGPSRWYRDSDEDGYGSEEVTLDACERPDGYTDVTGDCSDAIIAINPEGVEVCDVLDRDEDCDGLAEDDDPSVSGQEQSCYLDEDGDGAGARQRRVTRCQCDDGYVDNHDDCNDGDAAINPDASEIWYNGVDNNCDGRSDADQDGDGYDATSEGGTDCDDLHAQVNPGNTEVCDYNNLDEDCSGAADDEDPGVWPSSLSNWYADSDGDGEGGPGLAVVSCDAPPGYSSKATDCDDADDSVYTGAPERCDDGQRNDCGSTEGEARITCLYGSSATLDGGLALTGPEEGDHAGATVTFTGDVDGDGDDDLLIGGPWAGGRGERAGAAWLVRSPVLVGTTLEAMDRFETGTGPDEVGKALAGPGDVDGDGMADLLLGVSNHDLLAEGGGLAAVVYGPAVGGLALYLADSRLAGTHTTDGLGASVAGAGDLDGDGLSDLLVGAPGDDTSAEDAGAAYAVLGPAEGVMEPDDAAASLLGVSAGDAAGAGVCGVGDVNGDGYADLLVGAAGEDSAGDGAGAAYLALGPVSDTLSLRDADAALQGEESGAGLGATLAAPGDLNGDGYADLAMATPEISWAGMSYGLVFAVHGPVAGTLNLTDADLRLGEEGLGDQAGSGLSGAGDVNLDGYPDLLIGARRHTVTGSVYLVLGPRTGTVDLGDAERRWDGAAAEDFAGASVAGAGDTNGDGYPDLLMGAPYTDTSGADAGTAYLYVSSEEY